VITRIPVSETALLEFVRDVSRMRGWLSYHTRDSRRSDPGFPDLVLVRRPRLVFAELKAAGKHPTRFQRDWLSALAGVGDATDGLLEVYIWRPADLDEIRKVLW
jgi:hypothetical protein